MSNADRLTGRSADDVLADVLDLSAASGFSLGAFMRVSSVEWNERVRTACVECTERPRLLLNRDFVAKRCATPERLAMLLLHELSHIALGHTRLYPRPTPAHNIAFDALINAQLVSLLRERGIDPAPYAALFCDCYGAAEDPLFLLRPPPGWPHAPRWGASHGCTSALRAIHRRLYDVDALAHDVTYGEIIEALRTADIADTAGRLLGAHGTTDVEVWAARGTRDARAAELLADTLRSISGEYGQGWSAAHAERLLIIEHERVNRSLQRALQELLRRVFTAKNARTRRWTESAAPIVTVDPTGDRRAAARALLARHYATPAPRLFDGSVIGRRPARTAATVYLDVSGSMHGVLDPLHAALASLHRLLAAEVLAFSCDVVPVSMADFRRGRLATTYGTDISPVLLHALSRPNGQVAQRALVLTDGYFKDPAPALVAMLRAARIELHVGVMGDGPLPDSSWASSSTRLPRTPPLHATAG